MGYVGGPSGHRPRHRFASVIWVRSRPLARPFIALDCDHSDPRDACGLRAIPVRSEQNAICCAGADATATRQAGFDLRTAPSRSIAHRSVVRKVTVARKPDPATPAVLNAHPAQSEFSVRWRGELLYRGRVDGERGEIQYPCDDSGASDPAIWHPLAGDERHQRALGRGPHQRSEGRSFPAASSICRDRRRKAWEWSSAASSK